MSIFVARIAAVAVSVGGPGGDALLFNYVDRIARQRMYDYIASMLANVSAHMNAAKYGDHGDNFKKSILNARKDVAVKRGRANDSFLLNAQIVQELNHYERIVMSRIPQNLNRSYLFAKGLK